MAHHKRGRRKNARAGCLLCKAHKANGMKGRRCDQALQERRARDDEREQRNEEPVSIRDLAAAWNAWVASGPQGPID